jgi:hypothetical protein
MSTATTVLLAALELLGVKADTAAVIHLVDVRPVDVSVDADAFVRRNPDAIYVITSTPIFQGALRLKHQPRNHPAMRLLASVIAHELWHLQHGQDERGAYHMQLVTLWMLGSPPDSPEYYRVMKAMHEASTRVRGLRLPPSAAIDPARAALLAH